MSSRSRWKLMVVLGTVLVVGAAGTLLLIRKSQERKEFVSRAVLFTKYRCRFTVSTAWQCNVEPHKEPYVEERRTFTLPQNPIRQWIERHLLHRAPPPTHTITITYGVMGGLRALRTVNGVDYFEPAVYPPEQIERERYFMIDNCPTTIATIKSGSARATKLMVNAPDGFMEYWLDSSAEEVSFPETDREVQAIISSLHFENVPPTNGQQ